MASARSPSSSRPLSSLATAVAVSLLIHTVGQPIQPENPLAADAAYSDTLTRLPEDNYNIIVYLNQPVLQEFSLELNAQMGLEMPGSLTALSSSIGGQVIGLTILDGDTLTLDLAQQPIDPALYEEIYSETFVPTPMDLSFAGRVPADAVLLSQSSQFGPATQIALDNLRGLRRFIEEQGGLGGFLGLPLDFLDAETRLALNLFNLDMLLATFNISFSGLTGLSLENDVLPVLDGDSVTYLRVVPSQGVPFLPVLPELAVIFQTSDEAGAAALVEALQNASERYDAGYSIEAYGNDGAALNIDVLSQALGQPVPQLDFLFASSDDVFAFGTRGAVEASFNSDAYLSDSATFADAQTVFLPEAQGLLYIDLAPIGTLIDDLVAEGVLPPSPDVRETRLALSLLEHSTITIRANDDLSTIIRMTITVSDEPLDMSSEAAIVTDEAGS